MKTLLRLAHFGLFGTLGLLLVPSVFGADNAVQSKVDYLFAQWDRPDSPGVAVVIVKDGEVVYQHGYGTANLELGTPITPRTSFDVASAAKQFTGMALAMLIEQHKISLDDDIHQYLPEVPDFGKLITIGNLVHHTSGLRDWPETLALAGIDLGGEITLDTILEMVRRQRELDFPPGQEHLYSNTGYNLLAAAIAKVSGSPFADWTDANIFRPLGMTHTRVCVDPRELVPNRAESYAPAGGRRWRRVVSQLAAQGSSSLFITAEDMGKWLLNFDSGKVGGKKAIQLMQQPGKLNSGGRVDYGFGVALGTCRGNRMIVHTGGWSGYRSAVLWLPEKRLAVGLLSNAANLNSQATAQKVADVYLGSAPEPKPKRATESKPAGKPDPKAWAAYLGTYRLGPGWLLTISREGDRLMVQATHESKFRMTPRGETEFYVPAYGAAVEFRRNAAGVVDHLDYRGIHAPRLSLPELSPAQLTSYVGDYWSDELRTAYRVELRDGQLGARTHAGTWVGLLPTDADRFDTEVGGLAIEFTRDSASAVNEMLISGSRIRHIRFHRAVLPPCRPSAAN